MRLRLKLSESTKPGHKALPVSTSCPETTSSLTTVMTSEISFGDANSGIQTGIISGNAEIHQHLPPGKLLGFRADRR